MGGIGGSVICTVVVMTNAPRPQQLDDLRTEWRSLGRSRPARTALEHLRATHPPLAEMRAQDLCEVVELLEPHSGLSQLERAQLAACLLSCADKDPLIARALLQTLLPGLVAVARRLDWGRGRAEDPATFLADLITAAYEVIQEWGGQSRPYAAPDLLNAVRCRMRRRLIAERTTQMVPLDAISDAEPLGVQVQVEPTEGIEALVSLLASGDQRLGIIALYGREVLGFTYKELAERTGYSARMLSAAGREVARRNSA